MAARIYKNGRHVETQENGETTWSRQNDLADAAAEAARSAVKNNDGEKAAEDARQGVLSK